MFQTETLGRVVAPPLWESLANGKLMAIEHSVGGVTVDT